MWCVRVCVCVSLPNTFNVCTNWVREGKTIYQWWKCGVGVGVALLFLGQSKLKQKGTKEGIVCPNGPRLQRLPPAVCFASQGDLRDRLNLARHSVIQAYTATIWSSRSLPVHLLVLLEG